MDISAWMSLAVACDSLEKASDEIAPRGYYYRCVHRRASDQRSQVSEEAGQKATAPASQASGSGGAGQGNGR